MGSDIQNTDESMAEIMQAIQGYFPDTQAAISSTYMPQAAREFEVTQAYTPKYAQLTYDTLSNEGRKLAEIGRELSKEEQLGASQTELDIARGIGRDLTQETVNLQGIIDPEFINGRAQIGDAVSKALSAIDPNSLTKGETESISRGLARTGAALPSGQEAAMQALTFGDALGKRRAEYNQAIMTGASALPATRMGVTGLEAGTKRTLLPNFGQAQYTGVQTPGVNSANSLGGQFLNSATQVQQTAMSKQKDWIDKMQGITKSISNVGSMFNPMSMMGG